MKKFNSKKAFLIYAIALTFLVLAAPLIAGVLTTFNPGETISSSAVNGNFANLQDQIDTVCRQPGQIVVAAEVDEDGNLVGEPFSCTGATVTTEKTNPDGTYQVTVEGLDHTDFFIRVSSIWIDSADTFCTVAVNVSVPIIRCTDTSTSTPNDNSFLITWIRKP